MAFEDKSEFWSDFGTIFEASGDAKMSKSVGVFARNHFSAFSTCHRNLERFGLDFGRLWAPFWEVFRLQERKIGVQEGSENEVEKDDENEEARAGREQGVGGMAGAGRRAFRANQRYPTRPAPVRDELETGGGGSQSPSGQTTAAPGVSSAEQVVTCKNSSRARVRTSKRCPGDVWEVLRGIWGLLGGFFAGPKMAPGRGPEASERHPVEDLF